MREPAIAPAARSLAEENNVDWRVLEGSGEGGSVVEQDVLGYLARVMQGDEATNPTPEPLPEGMTAWPEEAQRRAGDPSVRDLFAAPLNPPAAPPVPEPDARAPWLRDVPKPEPVVPADDGPTWGAFAAEPPPAEPAPQAPTVGAVSPVPEPSSAAGVPEEAHRAVLAELNTLRDRLAALEDERRRHLGELEGLSQMQATIAQQRSETAKLGPLQGEVQTLRAQLARAQREAERAAALEAQNRDLEGRLERARAFRDEAKIEFDRLTALNADLEARLAAPKRPWWRFWG